MDGDLFKKGVDEINKDNLSVKLTDIISSDSLQKIQDSFAKATGMAALTVDLQGPVTKLSNATDFCMKYTRTSKLGQERCNKCDLKGSEESCRTGRPSVYYCHGGLMDFSAPIFIGKTQIGSFIGGQVLPEPPDLEKFRKIALELNINPDEYVAAVKKVKIVPKQVIDAAAELLYDVANTLSQVGYQRLQSKLISENVFDISKKIHDEIYYLEEGIKNLISSNVKLQSDFEKLQANTKKSHSEVEQTDEVAKYISSISTQTRLLGLNASVEAAHAKEYGLGFAVIAQEVRTLGDSSTQQSAKIKEILGNIKSSIKEITEQYVRTKESIDSSDEIIGKLKDNIDKIREYACSLEKIK